MATYLLNIEQPDGPPPPQEFLDEIRQRLARVNEGIKAAGGWVFSAGLAPAESSTVVHVRDGETFLTDGPYVEAKEHVGGFWLVEAPDLDQALVWAEQASAACTLPIEVRPVSFVVPD